MKLTRNGTKCLDVTQKLLVICTWLIPAFVEFSDSPGIYRCINYNLLTSTDSQMVQLGPDDSVRLGWNPAD